MGILKDPTLAQNVDIFNMLTFKKNPYRKHVNLSREVAEVVCVHWAKPKVP